MQEGPEPTTPTPYVGKRVARPSVSTSSDAPGGVTPHSSPAPVARNIEPQTEARIAPLPRPVETPVEPAAQPLVLVGGPLSPVEVPTPRRSAEWTLFAAQSPEDTGALPFALTEAFTGSFPRIEGEPGTDFAHDTTVSMPAIRPGGKRRATKHTGRRGPLFRGLPSLPVLVGVAALAVSAGGALTAGKTDLVGAQSGPVRPATAMSGTSAVAAVGVVDRDTVVSRGESRAAAESTAKEREASLAKLGQQAAGRSETLKANQWQLPMEPGSYRITATFGQYGLWARSHTGLDFAGPTGTPIYAVANGVITSTGSDGAYGYKTVLTLDDGTEIWFCHQSEIDVEPGEQVRGGEMIGRVGSTGNTTGPHLHLEVRPGGGDPVNPYSALVAQGIEP